MSSTLAANPRISATQRRGPALVSLCYIVTAVTYIFVSDRILGALVDDAEQSLLIQTIKGATFVTLSGLLIWFLTARLVRSLEKVNAELARRERHVRGLLDSAPIPLCVLRDGRFEYLNAEAMRLLGGRSNIVGAPAADLVPEPDRARFEATIRDAVGASACVWIRDVRMLGRDGREFDAEIAASPFVIDHGAILLVIVDVTERRRMEHAVRQSQKLEAVGRLAAGIAHEFNNSLTAIMGLAAIVRDAGHEHRRELVQIEEVAQQAAELSRSLLTMSRHAPMKRTVQPLRPVLDYAAKIATASMPASIAIEQDLHRLDGALVLADAGQLRQAIMNLALNARDAMPEGGRLVFRGFIRERNGSDEAVIEVEDTGVGIPEDAMPDLWTPFFTTKPQGAGTGLGLPVTKGIVEEHGGAIEVESTLGKGTRFRILLPLANSAAPTP